MIDLTYVRVKQHWHYLCVMVDVCDRKIVVRNTGKQKNPQLVMDAISQILINSVALFHSDGGKAFDNYLLDECLS
ncbi:transposase family protein [Candidatus Schmidhempelia bombi]|uniref:transposase family protein n=1 Tax=Candidatus Schmidhempelia bombi TaxID=1505866 RepID=UPI0004B9F99C|nr:transposase family protein [Candidatus Schmidhempelia bombi]